MAQAAYFGLTGLWPLIHLPSFLRVTGPKTDLWLVRTVGALITCIAAAMTFAWWNGQIDDAVVVLSLSTAAALCAVDLIFVAKKVISPIYLADAAAEVILLGLWATAL